MAYYQRLEEYRNELPQEAPQHTDIIPPPDWPHAGKIEFQQVDLKYRADLPSVLHNATFTIYPKEKIGIVGRTGAGKSSLTMALFRLTEIHSGKILIDDIDTRTIGLDDLRSKLAIIPQDPVLFIGSVRTNLDPFEQHSDMQLWDALKRVYLDTLVRSLPGGLEGSITEGGDNFSVGQRQLICIARALLRNSQILVLDEATASIDNETDNLIQQTIRSSFVDCTVLTIAHRLHTIIDSDRIMVLDHGTVVEFDKPDTLLHNPHSFFSRLVEETNPETAKALKATAAALSPSSKKTPTKTIAIPVQKPEHLEIEVEDRKSVV